MFWRHTQKAIMLALSSLLLAGCKAGTFSSSQSSSAKIFEVVGITGFGDSVKDNLFYGSSDPVLTWTSSDKRVDKVDLSIIGATTGTCSQKGVKDKSVTFTGCNLTTGNKYSVKADVYDKSGKSISSNSEFSFTVVVAFDHLTISATTSTISTSPISVTVIAKDASNNAMTSLNGVSIQLTVGDSTCAPYGASVVTISGGAEHVPLTSGIATFTSFNIKSTTYSPYYICIYADNGGSPYNIKQAISVTPGVLNRVSFQSLPTGKTADDTFQLKVNGFDANNNAVTTTESMTVSVHTDNTCTDASEVTGTVNVNNFPAAVSLDGGGVATTATNLGIKKIGSYYLRAKVSAAIVTCEGPVVISSGAFNDILLTVKDKDGISLGAAGTISAIDTFSAEVVARDTNQNPISGKSITLGSYTDLGCTTTLDLGSFKNLNGSNGSAVSSDSPNTGSDGKATFSSLRLSKAGGPYYLCATHTTPSIKSNAVAVSVASGPVANIALASIANTTVGTLPSLTLNFTDAEGNGAFDVNKGVVLTLHNDASNASNNCTAGQISVGGTNDPYGTANQFIGFDGGQSHKTASLASSTLSVTGLGYKTKGYYKLRVALYNSDPNSPNPSPTFCSNQFQLKSSTPFAISTDPTIAGGASITAGQTFAVTQSGIIDMYNNPVDSNSDSVQVGFYSDNLCNNSDVHLSPHVTVAGSTTSIVDGVANLSNSTYTYVRPSTGITYYRVTVAPSLVSSCLPFTVSAAGLNNVAVSGSSSVDYYTCSQYTVTGQDQYSNPIALSSSVGLAITNNSAFDVRGIVSGVSDCSSTTSSVSPVAGQATFYFLGRRAVEGTTASAKVTATVSGQSGNTDITVVKSAFGNGRDLDLNITDTLAASAIIVNSDTSALGRRFAAARIANKYTKDASTVTFELPTIDIGTNFDFKIGDEIIWTVIAASESSSTCANLLPGDSGTEIIDSLSMTTITVYPDFTKSLLTNLTSGSNVPLSPTNSTATGTSGFCVIQVQRIPNIRTIQSNHTQTFATLEPSAFSLGASAGGASTPGGIIAIRAKSLTYLNTGGLEFSASGKGFRPGQGISGGEFANNTGRALSTRAGKDNAGRKAIWDNINLKPQLGANGGGGFYQGAFGQADTATFSANSPTTMFGFGLSQIYTALFPVSVTQFPANRYLFGGGGGIGYNCLTGTQQGSGGIVLVYIKDFSTDFSGLNRTFKMSASGGTSLYTPKCIIGEGGHGGGTVRLSVDNFNTDVGATSALEAMGGWATNSYYNSGGSSNERVSGGGAGGTIQVLIGDHTPHFSPSFLNDVSGGMRGAINSGLQANPANSGLSLAPIYVTF